MQLSARILGAEVVRGLAARASVPVLIIGADRFRRSQLAAVGCFNFIAAAHLSEACAALGVKHTRHLFESVPPSALVLPGIGAIALAVLGAAFEVQKLGGDQPLEAWAARHRAKDAKRAFVTFSTMKTQEAKREAGERRAKKARAARKAARRDTAHRLRVDRFTTRQLGASTPHATH